MLNEYDDGYFLLDMLIDHRPYSYSTSYIFHILRKTIILSWKSRCLKITLYSISFFCLFDKIF